MTPEIIDLTVSTPPPIVISDKEAAVATSNGTEKEKRKRKKSKKSHQEDRDSDKRWKHDKYLLEAHGQPEKSRQDDDGDDDYSRRRKEPARSSSPLFTVDTTPGEVAFVPTSLAASSSHTDTISPAKQNLAKNGLLLPLHVTLAVDASQSMGNINTPLSPVSEASGIDFVDDDRVVGAPRYFDDRTINPKTRGPCKRCGGSDHDLKNCTTMICLTCGARDEHSSRSCPILRLCYSCKGKGHIARDCPRIGDMDTYRLDRNDCERCGSWKHHGTNCPTIWRIYTYLTDVERDAVLAERESKRQLGFDDGGEGYIARDEWCYNCGNSGHLGDDCEIANANYDKPDDYSAFGDYNKFTGPFTSTTSVMPHVTRAPREWEQDDRINDGYGFSAQINVGKRGRENANARAREAQRLLDEADDEPDWFNEKQAASKGKAVGPPLSKSRDRDNLPPKPTPPTIQLGSQRPNSSRPPWVPSPGSDPRPLLPSRPSLRDRIDMGAERRAGKSRREDKRTGDTRRKNKERLGRNSPTANVDERGDGMVTDPDGYGMHKARQREGGSRWHGGYSH